MIITIGGLAGSGTSTTGKLLSENLNIPIISAGDIFRQMAQEKNLNLLEFSKLAEKNPEIDIQLDKRQAKIAENTDNLITEGRLSAHFVEADLKIWLIAPFDVRVKRISQRESKTIKQVKKEITIRETSEQSRYKEIHDIDITNINIYDIIINSNSFQTKEIVNIINNTIKK